MVNLDSTRESRDGDQFHYFWAAQRCLQLLDLTSDLTAVAVEGAAPNDLSAGLRTSSAHEIDIAEYFGGTNASDATRIVYRQLKHSTTQRDIPWGPAGLKSSISRFAALYRAAAPSDRDKYRYQFVSNRAVSTNVRMALSELTGATALTTQAKATRDKFTAWAKLDELDPSDFFLRFDVDASAPALRELASAVALGLGELLPGPNSDATLRLKEMVAERATTLNRSPIYRGDLLVALKVSERDLFPAPTEISAPPDPLVRESWREIVDAIRQDPSPHIIHASGGVGKTTFALTLPSLIESNDRAVVYDCYANGAYRRLGEARHNPAHGFVQIANTLAAYGLCQVLVPDSNISDEDWARAFLARVVAASEAVSSTDPDALIVLIVDAADSSVIASKADISARPFVRALLRQALPSNFRVVMTSRTERVEDLEPPPNAVRHLLGGFDRTESAQHLRNHFPHASDADAHEFHQRTFGNPRIQNGALSGPATVAELLTNLSELPNSPEQAFDRILHRRVIEVLDESPNRAALEQVLHILAALRPRIPVDVVAQLTGASESTIRSFASDLGGPLLLDGDALQFKDEPTETFVRYTYMPRGTDLRTLIEMIRPEADKSVYLASSLPQLLWETDDLDGLLSLAMSEDSLPAADHFERQQVDKSRSIFATRAAIANGRFKEGAILAARCGVLNAGGSRRIALLTRHPDLGGDLLEEATVEQLVSDREARAGSIPSSLAREGCLLSIRPGTVGIARSRLRSANSWVQAWSRLPKQQRDNSPVDDTDIANVAFGLLNTDGPETSFSYILSWRPNDVHYLVARTVFSRLLDRGDEATARALAQTAAKNVRVLLGYAFAAFDANVAMVPEAASALFALLQKRKREVKVSQLTYQGPHQISAAVCWTVACALREKKIAKDEASILVQRYVGASAPSGLASAHGDRNEEAFFSIGLRTHLVGEDLVAEHFADTRLSEELSRSYSSGWDVTEFRNNIPGLVPWIKAWISASIGDSSCSPPPIATLPTSVADYMPAYVLANSAPRIASRLVAIGRNSTRTGELKAWFEEATHLWHSTAIAIARFLGGGNDAAQDFAIEVGAHVAKLAMSDGSDAETRSRTLADIARALRRASEDEAREHLSNALEQAERAGDDLPHLWDAILRIGGTAAQSGDAHLAFRIARLAEAIEPNFEVDFQRALELCCKLDLPGGLSIASRWRDRRTAALSTISSALAGDTGGPLAVLDPGLALAFAHFGGRVDMRSMLDALFRQSDGVPTERKAWVADRMLRRLGEHPGLGLRSVLEGAGIPVRTAELHPDDTAIGNSSLWRDDPAREKKEARARTRAIARARQKDLTTPEGLLAASRLLGRHYGTESTFADLAFELPTRKWATVIRALAQVPEFDEYDYKTAFAVMERLRGMPASAKTAAKHLVQHVVAQFGPEMLSRTYERISIKTLATFADESSIEFQAALFRGSASALDLSEAESAYSVVGNLADVVSASEAVELIERLTESLSYLAMPDAPDPSWTPRLQPSTDPWLAVASFVWASLADPSADTRWRATYVVLTLCELDNARFVAALDQVARSGEPKAFIDERLSFYELHAVLWLLIAISRAAKTAPRAPGAFEPFLTHVVARYPTHALFRQLIDSILDTQEVAAPKTVVKADYQRPGQRRHSFWVSETAFKFRGDFVEYWLQPLANCFEVDLEEVEQEASDVIATAFDLGLSGTRSEDARHTLRIFGDQEKTYLHKHSDPQVHDLDFYVSYHAMFIVAGVLRRHKSVYRDPEHEFDDYQRWVRREGLTRPDRWLVSDLRSARPASVQHQPLHGSDPTWRWSVKRTDFLAFVQQGGQATVNLYSRVAGYSASERVRVNTALAAEDRSLALIRSLQVDRAPSDFRLPDAGEDFEIDVPGYELRGWIDYSPHDLRLDRSDPFAKGLSFPPVSPAEWVSHDAGLDFRAESNSWADPQAFEVYDLQSWQHADDPRHDRGEEGHLLSVQKSWLDAFLSKRRLDLVVEVSIDRNQRSAYQSTRHSEEWLEYVESYTQLLLYRAHDGWYDYRGNYLAR
ncbi:hypothetical protein [Leifsonia shinshuensis]|uniref:ATP-binding protein n=1 Tax=Leifsonia shinshuensis TaxID=150026 RepID=A0A7G6YED9_9MICO|nr:hypothetical protein [Leifsonia shinshuensis]QNE36854.1 hypothetical protein F1C12_18195 [Leifsonia shinshuensis]